MGEWITEENEACVGIERDQSGSVFDNVSVGSGLGKRWSDACASRTMEIASQNVCAVSHVVELPTFDGVGLRWEGLAIPFQGLDPRLFIDTHGVDPMSVLHLNVFMDLTDVCNVCGNITPILTGGMFPVPTSVRLEDRVL